MYVRIGGAMYRETKDERISIKLTEKEKRLLERKALLYAEGNLSRYLIYCGSNFIPDKNELKKRKGP